MVKANSKNLSADSVISFQNSQGLTSKGTLINISRNSVIFEVYNPYSVVQLSEVLSQLTIKKQGGIIYKGKAVVVNLLNTGLILVVSVSLVEDWLGQLENLSDVDNSIRKFIEDWKSHRKLLPGFRLAVEEMQSFFSELGRWLNVLQTTHAVNSQERLDHLVDEISATWIELAQQFEAEAAKVPEELDSIHKTFAQHQLHALFLSAPFVHRTYVKPLGFAGDHEMISMILRNEYEGPTDYAKIIHKLNIGMPTAVSVCNRNNIMLDYIVTGVTAAMKNNQPFRMLSIGCGPAFEVQRFIKQSAQYELAQDIKIELLDFSKETLEETKAKITDLLAVFPLKQLKVTYIQESVHVLLKDSDNDDRMAQYDLIYSGGLYDYLSDRVCSRLLRLLYQWLKPGGKIFTTNMHLNDPERFWMAYILEWYLIYRNENDLLNWVKNLGKQRVFADETGINLFLEIIKPEYSISPYES